jgi:ribosomal protein S18 acetylase RimI-like enzyme
MVTVAAASTADIDAVLEFWNAATTVASSTDDVAGIEALLAFDPSALLIARDGSDVVGTVITGWDGWRATMYRLAVAPVYRRQGVATALVAEGEKRLRALGARRFHLVVQADEAAAQSFWLAVGYEATDQLRFVKTVA